jgi:MHS family shikimate/dehydroshikimate transporter-like MFS transporter
MRPIVLASVLGSVVEWYDFVIYGTAAALVFNTLFFPSLDPLAGTLAAFVSYAVGFLVRPLGGIIFGHFGDKIGRRSMLTVTMIIMGAGTFLIGCLPTHEQIGILAPIALVLLRIVQGLGVGGEWGGAVLMVIENANPRHRGLFGSLVQLGFPAAVALSMATFLGLSLMPEDDFLSWGWRIPFLFSVVLIGVGLFVRLRLTETAAFAQVKKQHVAAKVPLLELLRNQPKTFLAAAGLKFSEVAWAYLLTTFSITYITQVLGLEWTLALWAIFAAGVLEVLTLPLFGALSDRIGRRPVFFASLGLSVIAAFALFPLLNTADPVVVVATVAIALVVTHAPMYGTEAALIPEQFGTNVRYTGAGVAVQVAGAISGGLTPVVATGILAGGGDWLPIAFVLVAAAAITFVATLAVKETVTSDLTDFVSARS